MKKLALILALSCVIPTAAYARNCPIHDYSEGVYFFDCGLSNNFGATLAEFKQNNPRLAVTAIASSDLGIYGSTSGYFVSTEPRKK